LIQLVLLLHWGLLSFLLFFFKLLFFLSLILEQIVGVYLVKG
jgi:hypothetical protein